MLGARAHVPAQGSRMLAAGCARPHNVPGPRAQGAHAAREPRAHGACRTAGALTNGTVSLPPSEVHAWRRQW